MKLPSLSILSAFAGIQLVFGASVPVLPTNDPFYQPNDPLWKSKPLGSILDIRNISLSALLPDAPITPTAFQLLYRSQNGQGQPDASVTTIIVPVDPDLNRVLSVQTPYDSPDPNCSPSYGFQFGSTGFAALYDQLGIVYLSPYLQKGPILVVPDYEGSKAAFGVGPTNGFHVLDSLRAVLSSAGHAGVPDYAQINSSANAIMFGYSSGAIATEWATEKKSWYAPELPIVGACIGAALPNITNSYFDLSGGSLAELGVGALLGMMNEYPEFDEYMEHEVLEEAESRFYSPRVRCSPPGNSLIQQLGLELAYANISSFFKNGDAFLHKFKNMFTEIGVMGNNITKDTEATFPLMFYYSNADEVIQPIEESRNLINKWRGTGTLVYQLVRDGLDHVGTNLMLSNAFDWIDQRFDVAELPESSRPQPESSNDDDFP